MPLIGKVKSSWMWWAALLGLVLLLTFRVRELVRSETGVRALPSATVAQASDQPAQPGNLEAAAEETGPSSVEATEAAPQPTPMPGTRKKTGPLSLEEAEALYDDQAESMANLLWVKSDAYFHAGRYDDVIELAKAVVNLDPGFVEAWLGAAWFLWSDEERDRDPEAIELYHMAMERNPQAWDIPFEMGFLYYYSHKRDAKTALPYIQKAAEVAPPSQKAKVLRALGQVFRKLGRTKEALETFREVLKINPSDVVAKREVERLRGLVEP